MIDLVLLAARLLLIALLYLFLFAAIRAGLGLVRGAAAATAGALVLEVVKGPRELTGVRVPLQGPVVIGRSPGADIVIANDFVSGRHARVEPRGDSAVVEDLGSTNGTVVGGRKITGPAKVSTGDTIDIGSVRLRVART